MSKQLAKQNAPTRVIGLKLDARPHRCAARRNGKVFRWSRSTAHPTKRGADV